MGLRERVKKISEDQNGTNEFNLNNTKVVSEFKKMFWLVLEYKEHCRTLNTTIEDIKPIQIIIFLSKYLESGSISADDLKIVLKYVSLVHTTIEGNPLYKCKQIQYFMRRIPNFCENNKYLAVNDSGFEEMIVDKSEENLALENIDSPPTRTQELPSIKRDLPIQPKSAALTIKPIEKIS